MQINMYEGMNCAERHLMLSSISSSPVHVSLCSQGYMSWYVDLFNKKGMLNKKGARNLEHPHFQTTPLKMVTRSKAAKHDVGGSQCDKCGII